LFHEHTIQDVVTTILKVAPTVFLAAACVNFAVARGQTDLSEGPRDSSLVGILEPADSLNQQGGDPISHDGPVAVGDVILEPGGVPNGACSRPTVGDTFCGGARVNRQPENSNCGAIAFATLLCRG
jgi:hypothetical protein